MFIFSYTRILAFSHWNLTACFWKTCLRLSRPVLFSLSRCIHSLVWDQLRDPQSGSMPPVPAHGAAGAPHHGQNSTPWLALSSLRSASLSSGGYAVLKSNSCSITMSSPVCSTSWSRRHRGIGEDTEASAALISGSRRIPSNLHILSSWVGLSAWNVRTAEKLSYCSRESALSLFTCCDKRPRAKDWKDWGE